MKKSQGITLIGMLLTMAVIVISSIIVMRVVPVYLRNYEITHSISALNGLPASDFSEDADSNAMVLKNRLLNQLSINGIQDIEEKQIHVTPANENVFKVSVKYKVLTPLVANVSLLFDFNAEQEVSVHAK